MTKAIRFDKAGGPEVMKWVDVDVGAPGKGEIRVKHHAVGLNFIDVYFRTGLYPMPLPGGLGMEAAGEVTAVGEGVTQFKPGDRVAYASRPPGAYAQERVMSADYVVRLPDSISYEDAASIMLQGLTAQYLLRRTYRVKAGDTVLIHAAAGGVGMLACQWAKALRLRDDSAKVVDIALDCGFNDLSNFNHAFRAEFASSPLAWRARGRARRT